MNYADILLIGQCLDNVGLVACSDVEREKREKKCSGGSIKLIDTMPRDN
jgi:hypothetical protein